MSSHIFIAFADADKATGERIVRTIENSGTRCWFAPRDLTPGMSWGDAVVDAIVSAQLVVILASAAGNESPTLYPAVEAAVRLSPSAQVPLIAFIIDSLPIDRGVGLLVRTAGIPTPSLPDDAAAYLLFFRDDGQIRRAA